jgi:hypothetical protein
VWCLGIEMATGSVREGIGMRCGRSGGGLIVCLGAVGGGRGWPSVVLVLGLKVR